MENNRGQWGSNFGFIMAAVGSAVGLGNLWGFPYKMRFDRAEAKQLLIAHGGKFHRLLRATFTNLCYENAIGKWTPAIDHFWGHGCLLAVQESPDGSFMLNSLLYMDQDQFESASAADDLMLD